MPSEPGPLSALARQRVTSALRVSLASVAWTFLSSVVAVVIGIEQHTLVLIAFGAVGVVDAVGSVALAYHFRHALRHDELSSRLEVIAHRTVLIGLLSVGLLSVLGGAIRWALGQVTHSSSAGVELASISLVVLVILSVRKRYIAKQISSGALRSDSLLSALGAVLAAVTIAGTVLVRFGGGHWADAVATIVVGSMALVQGAVTWRLELRSAESTSDPSDPRL